MFNKGFSPIGQQHETITLESLAYGGHAVGHIGGKVIFIPEGVPGDVVRVNISQDKGSYFWGSIEEILVSSPERVEPFCPYASQCGGCQWQMVDYESQLKWKRAIVEESLRRISGFTTSEVEPCLASPIDRNYRTVIRLHSQSTGPGNIIGYHERRTHSIIDIESCPIASERVNEILSCIRTIIKQPNTSVDIHEVTIRASQNHPSALISITTSGHDDITSFASQLFEKIPGLTGISHWRISGTGKTTHVQTYGKPFFYETVKGKTLRICERSFFQVNVVQAEQMVNLIGTICALDPGSVIVDGYGGVGLFSLCIAPQDSIIHLYDLSESAVEDSRFNAHFLGYTSFTALRKDTVSAMVKIGHADTLIIDPPRTGLGRKAVTSASSLGAQKVIYISCNPTTLARDVKMFAERGYAIERVIPVDMFPQTYHIETVVGLVRT